MKNLATEEDVTDILNIYHEYFESNVEDEDEQPIPDSLPVKEQLNDDGGDFGMEVESTMPPKALAKALAFFKTGLPPAFNPYRHRSGTSPWDDDRLFVVLDHEIMPEYLVPMKLHWHQLAGVHSILRSIFTKEKKKAHTTGVLIGDEVGLGKTAQSITVIAFLNQLIWLQGESRGLPPVLGEPISMNCLVLSLMHHYSSQTSFSRW